MKLHVVEGEKSDSWVMWEARLPTLGIPGNTSCKCLAYEHTIGFETVYIHQEADKGGKTYADGMVKHLAGIGFAGSVYVVTMPEGCKDIGDVFARDPAGFRDAVTEMEIGAREILTRAPPEDGSNANDAGEKKPGGFVYAPMTTAQLLDAAEPEWLIDGLLVAGQPTVMGGPL